MKTALFSLLLLFLFLTACNGSGTTYVTDPALVAKVDALTKALAAATHADAKKFAGLKIIGKTPGGFSLDAGRVVNAVSFGPCANMGVLVGFTNPNFSGTADPLTSTYQAFKQCTGYYYEAQVGNGSLSVANRLFWDGQNCTGNEYEWEAGGAGYNTQILQSGVVFLSPVDGTTELAVTAGQTPQPTLIQSVWVASSPGCQADVETQLLYKVVPNDTSVTGVPESVGASYQLSSP